MTEAPQPEPAGDSDLWREVPQTEIPGERTLARADPSSHSPDDWVASLGSTFAVNRSNGARRDDDPLLAFGLSSDGAGSVWFLTKDGVDPRPLEPPTEGVAGFGRRVEPIEDLDGDGVSDLLVLASKRDVRDKSVFVVSARTRSFLHVIPLSPTFRRERIEVCAVRDAEGRAAVAVLGVSSPAWPAAGHAVVQVISIESGEVMGEYEFEGVNALWPDRGAGRARLAPIGSLSAGAAEVLAVSTPSAPTEVLRALDPSSGRTVWRPAAPLAQRFAGVSMVRGADLDGDGVRELWVADVGAARDGGFARGQVRVLSGRSGELLFGVRGLDADESHGIQLASYPDQDGDGIDEVLVTDAWPLFSSRLLTLSGQDGKVLSSLRFNQDFWRLGDGLAVGEDWDGGGLPDLVVSNYLPEGGTQQGTHVIGVVSMEDARLLHHVTPTIMAERLRERDAHAGPK